MGNRLSRIYTRTGDDGSTGLGDGTRVGKDSARVGAYGTVDEANSAIALLVSSTLPIASIRGSSFGTRAPPASPVVPSSPVRV